MPLTIWIEIWFDRVMSDKDRQSHREPGDSGNSPPPRRPWLLGARLTLVKLVLVWFLMFWPPRYDSPAAARRASQPRPAAAAAEKELTLKDDDPWQSGQGGRPPRRSRRRRLGHRHPLPGPLRRSRGRHRGHGRLVHSLMTVCAVSTIIILLAVIVAISTWHPGGWPPL